VEHRSEIYKTVGGRELWIDVFAAQGQDSARPRPAIVFIHGGGWGAGEPKLFFPHCRYFASRGMVAVAPQYRLVTPDGGSTIRDCIADCKSAVRWLRANAGRLGIDPERIAVAGDSAGGHLAACTGVIGGLEEPGEDASLSSRPDALILLCAILDTTQGQWKRDGDHAAEISPLHHVAPGAPPTLVIHGAADTVVPCDQARNFAAAMEAAGNRCGLTLMEGTGHAFIVPGYGKPQEVVASMKTVDRFLALLGYVEGPPTITGLEAEPKSQ
jgi:acetyl esterase/lipase